MKYIFYIIFFFAGLWLFTAITKITPEEKTQCGSDSIQAYIDCHGGLK